jgi:hypothetical protein
MTHKKPLLLQRTAKSFIDLYRTSRNAGKMLGVDHAQLFRMAKGDVKDAGDEVLAKLGLERDHNAEIHRRRK